jgi:hypothetical protein
MLQWLYDTIVMFVDTIDVFGPGILQFLKYLTRADERKSETLHMRHSFRLLVIAIVLASCLALIGGAFLFCERVQEGTIASINFRRIRAGMSEEQVEKLFGQAGKPVERKYRPPDGAEVGWSIRPSGMIIDSPGPWPISGVEDDNIKHWWNREQGDLYVVVFDGEGKTRFTFDMSNPRPGRFEKLFQWFR